MARPRINPSARSIPISFSVKPHLAEKIEEYSHQLRFSRSKFLAQAVTEAITKIEMGYDIEDYDVRNMTDNQRLASALNALQNPTPEQQINPDVVRLLKEAILRYEKSTTAIDFNYEWRNDETGVYRLWSNNNEGGTFGAWESIAVVRKDGRRWRIDGDNDSVFYKTLKEAKAQAKIDGTEYQLLRYGRRPPQGE